MSEKNKSFQAPGKKTVLVAPLDWGLGHATRCVPIIKELISNDFEVIIAASGASYYLLKNEFPSVEFLTIDNYNIRYSSTKSGFFVEIIKQFPKIRRTIRKENKWLARLLKSRKIDFVISDNRPGLHHPKAFCIYITHQVHIKTGNTIFNLLAERIHSYFIRQFDTCWIPDVREGGLSGELSHPVAPNLKAIYIHPISRLNILPSENISYDIAILLSGPEPQRTIFEEKILLQLQDTKKKLLLLRGLPDAQPVVNPIGSITIINHLPSDELNKVLCNSRMIICRSGYTSVMDLVKLRKKAILIPTPGQTEQEYLGEYLMGKKYFLVKHQDDFDLEIACTEAQSFDYQNPVIDFEHFQFYIRELSNKNS